MFKALNNTKEITGKRKTFRFRSGFGSTTFTNNEPSSHTATLYGGFYDYDTAKTFRKVKIVRLDTAATEGKIHENEHGSDLWIYTIPATKEQVDAALQMAESYDHYWERPEITIYSKGVKNITQTYTMMGVSGD